MIYFDNAATTHVDKKVIETMIDVLENVYGNPSGKYYDQALKANKIVEEARKITANFLNAEKDEIIFNSGASEGNNHVLKGVALENRGSHIVTSNLEHNSTLKACMDLKEAGYEVTYLKGNNFGVVSLDDLKESIKSNTKLVSIIWANNEIGSVNNIEEISKICKEKNILLHVDATQIMGKIKIDLSKFNIDFLTFSGHKIYGPKGVGVLYIKRNRYGLFPDLKPLISGSQEDDQRGGTYCTHNIAGLGKAIEILESTQDKYIEKLNNLEEYLLEKLNNLPLVLNGYSKDSKVPGILNIQIPGVNNEIFIKENSKILALSTGSACSLSKPSHVLENIGIDKFKIRNSIRISLGKDNTFEEINQFIEILKKYI